MRKLPSPLHRAPRFGVPTPRLRRDAPVLEGATGCPGAGLNKLFVQQQAAWRPVPAIRGLALRQVDALLRLGADQKVSGRRAVLVDWCRQRLSRVCALPASERRSVRAWNRSTKAGSSNLRQTYSGQVGSVNKRGFSTAGGRPPARSPLSGLFQHPTR